MKNSRKLNGVTSTRTIACRVVRRTSVLRDGAEPHDRHAERASIGGEGVRAVQERPSGEGDGRKPRRIAKRDVRAEDRGCEVVEHVPGESERHEDDQRVDREAREASYEPRVRALELFIVLWMRCPRSLGGGLSGLDAHGGPEGAAAPLV